MSLEGPGRVSSVRMNEVVHAITRIAMAGPAPVLDAISVIAVLALAYIATTARKEK